MTSNSNQMYDRPAWVDLQPEKHLNDANRLLLNFFNFENGLEDYKRGLIDLLLGWLYSDVAYDDELRLRVVQTWEQLYDFVEELQKFDQKVCFDLTKAQN